jgi:phosphoribosylformimino-5-aminoimidazole carboxamide ribotide isomerase
MNCFCIHCIIGESGTEGYYQRLSRDPVELVKLLRRENTKTIHIVDSDSFNNIDNTDNISNIKFISESLDIPVEVLGKYNDRKVCEDLLDHGIYRIFVDEMLFKNTECVEDLIKKYTPSRIAFNIIAENDKLEFEFDNKKIDIYQYFNKIKSVNGNRILLGLKEWKHGKAIDFDMIENINKSYNFRITLSEGIDKPEVLWKVKEKRKCGIDSVVIGKPLYDNNFPCQRIWRMVEAKQEPIT